VKSTVFPDFGFTEGRRSGRKISERSEEFGVK
jgi:hypothetical protein